VIVRERLIEALQATKTTDTPFAILNDTIAIAGLGAEDCLRGQGRFECANLVEASPGRRGNKMNKRKVTSRPALYTRIEGFAEFLLIMGRALHCGAKLSV